MEGSAPAATGPFGLTPGPLFTNVDEVLPSWETSPVLLRHRMHESPLFSLKELGKLLENYPRNLYSIVRMSEQKSKEKYWREGEFGDMPGEEIIDAVRNHRMFINLRNVHLVDKRYADLKQAIFDEFKGKVPGFDTHGECFNLIISNSASQTYYHCDMPGQFLLHFHGRKRIWLYPAKAPYLTRESLELVSLDFKEINLPYDPSFDDTAIVHDLVPGTGLHWPLNWPHRVENLDNLNVSVALEYWSDKIRREHMMNVANGILRYKLGRPATSYATSGPIFLAKAALQSFYKRTGQLQKIRLGKRPIDFRLDRNAPEKFVDIEAKILES